ncbi:hypothetical protein KC19_VG124700 [Ceratodon purpureus]|uniref:Uncharacterized protein n=1 Tax=Ceratodon purpureus TaxID=3225 RepID=A0A8T0HQD8_CERPU|nr:hypothetical protein KC19_VG124600 [Ceratodon purpureus]KAG0572783.1 hypothetical protein KC19_VG124700 [Ceratodon purpureus]
MKLHQAHRTCVHTYKTDKTTWRSHKGREKTWGLLNTNTGAEQGKMETPARKTASGVVNCERLFAEQVAENVGAREGDLAKKKTRLEHKCCMNLGFWLSSR